MIRSFFIFESQTKKKIDTAVSLGATSIFTGHQNLSHDIISYAKKQGLKINVEIGIFQGEELWEKYFDCRPADKNGKHIEKIQWYAGVCPNHPRVRQDKLDLINKIVSEYDVDGIWLDFIRYPCFWENVRAPKITEYCFCRNCLSKFNTDVGGEPAGEKWTDWKNKQIVDFVCETKSSIPLSIKLGLFAVPWVDKDFDGAIKHIIGQDFGQLSKFINVFSPMTYHRFTGNKTSWINEITTYFSKNTQKPVLPLIQTEDRAGKITGEEFNDSLKMAMLPPSNGAIIFFLEDLMKDRNKLKTLKR